MKWLVIGHYGGNNTGDEAMLEGLLWGGRSVLNNVTLVTKNGYLPVVSYPTEVSLRAIRPVTISVLREIWMSDGVILGGGTHFHDDYRGLRYIRHLRHMFRILGVCFVAKLFKKRIFWLSMGFGPFFRSLTRCITKVGLFLCDGITTRDRISAQEAITLLGSNQSKHQLAFDLATLLVEKINLWEISKKSNLLGVSVTSVRNSLSGGNNVETVFWRHFEKALMKLISNTSVHIRIFVFRGGTHESDIELSECLYRALLAGSHDSGKVEIVPYDPDPINTLEKVAECEYFVATRFHSAIFSYLAGCRLLFLVYHRKLNDLAKEIGLSDNAVLPINGMISEEEIYNRLKGLTLEKDKYKPSLPLQEAIVRARKNFMLFNYLL